MISFFFWFFCDKLRKKNKKTQNKQRIVDENTVRLRSKLFKFGEHKNHFSHEVYWHQNFMFYITVFFLPKKKSQKKIRSKITRNK